MPGCDAVEVILSGKSMQGALSREIQSLDYDCITGRFSGDIATPAGGWYSAVINLKKKGAILAAATVAHIGVGELFIVSGQSNATNHGDTHQYPTSGMVSAFSGSEWRLANDPQPGNQDGSTGGSFIPAFGDALHATWQVPIGIASMGYGGTSVRQWLPKGEKIYVQPSADICCKQIGPDLWESEGFLYAGMMERINHFGPAGFRALLWHQGESDCDQAPDRQIEYEDYKAMMIHIIKSTRNEAGWKFPWMVAQASYHSPESPCSPGIRQMQAEIWNEGIALEGPDTDILDGDNRDFGGLGVHLSGKGLQNHGRMWAEKVSSFLKSILA